MKNNSVESEKNSIYVNNSYLSDVNQNVQDSVIISTDSHDINYYSQQNNERILPVNDSLNILMRICYLFYNELGKKKSIIILGPLLIINGSFSYNIFSIDFTEKSIVYIFIVLIPLIITFIILVIIIVALQNYDKVTCPNCNKRYSLSMTKKFLLDKYTHIDKQYEKICEKYVCKFCGNIICKEKTIEYSHNYKKK